MISGLLERQPGSQRSVGVPDRGQIRWAALVGGLYPVIKTRQVVSTCSRDSVVADSPPPAERRAGVIEAGHLRRVIPNPGDR